MNTKTFDQIIFDYCGASLPPPYHRSYVILINLTQAEVKIRDYSTLLVEKKIMILGNQWDNLTKIAQNLHETGEKIASGAMGTYQQTIHLNLKEKSVYQFTWDSLQDIEKTTQHFVDEIHQLIPDFEQLLANS